MNIVLFRFDLANSCTETEQAVKIFPKAVKQPEIASFHQYVKRNLNKPNVHEVTILVAGGQICSINKR
jgi:hypothetical protein